MDKFITIEGIDGAGKSSVINKIKQFLEEKGEEVVHTCEPGGTEFGLELRKMLLNKNMSLMSETLLMFAARAEHLDQVIIPALNAGKYVLCDRFTDSTFAYQAHGKGLPEAVVKNLENLVQEKLRPGITFLLDVPLSISKLRLAKTGKIPDKFESGEDAMKERIIQGYKKLARQNPNRCKIIDATGTEQQTLDQILLQLEDFHAKCDTKKKPKPF